MSISLDVLLPHVFAAVMGLALLLYVILDGYDLGVGLLLPFAEEKEKDQMIASIGPFWDANETWIVLGVGVLLIAFPQAHGLILTSLYLPVTLMLMGLVLRGIAFDFRIKAGDQHKTKWNIIFSIGSLIASVCQGWMLGAYITGLQNNLLSFLFSILTAISLPVLYIMLGGSWLMCRTTGALSEKAWSWSKKAWLPLGIALVIVSIATPLFSSEIANKWFSFPHMLWLMPVPLITLYCYFRAGFILTHPDSTKPVQLFICLIVICLMCSIGLGYSIYPDIIQGRLSILDAAANTQSLLFTFWGVLLTVPLILGYTVFVYRIFDGTVPATNSYE